MSEFIILNKEDALKYLTEEEKSQLCEFERKIKFGRSKDGLNPNIKYQATEVEQDDYKYHYFVSYFYKFGNESGFDNLDVHSNFPLKRKDIKPTCQDIEKARNFPEGSVKILHFDLYHE